MDGRLVQKFWSKVRVLGPEECWNWTGGLGRRGTGKFMSGLRSGYTSVSSRFSWMLHHGPVPNGLLVCHACDNPSCVNPRHLFLGTHQDNMDDMVKKGRASVIGKNQGMILPRKLSDEAVRAIRSDTRKLRAIAKEYGVSYQLVSRIKLRKSKKNVKD